MIESASYKTWQILTKHEFMKNNNTDITSVFMLFMFVALLEDTFLPPSLFLEQRADYTAPGEEKNNNNAIS